MDTDIQECYRCGEIGHFVWDCPKKEEPMLVDISNLHHSHVISVHVQAYRHPPHLSQVQVQRKDVDALLDFESMVSIIPSLLTQPQKTNTRIMDFTCVHGDTKPYPTTDVEIKNHQRAVPR